MRNTQVEGLRSVAIIFVLIFHFFCRFQQIYMNGESALPFPVSSFGGIGVGIFLLITGYFSQKSSGGGKMLCKRYKKLYPIYIVSISIIFVTTHFIYLPQRTVSIKDYFINFLLLGGMPGINYVDGAHWYLRTIFLLILFFAIVQKFKEPIKILSYFVVFFLIILCRLFYSYCNQNTLTKLIRGAYQFLGLDYFVIAFIGVGISMAMSDKRIQGVILALLCVISNIWIVSLFYTLVILFFSIILMLCLCNKITFFERKPFQTIASSSYSIYLIHQNIGFVIMLFLINIFGYHHWIALFTAITMMLIGVWFHCFIEQPLNKYIDKKMKRINQHDLKRG